LFEAIVLNQWFLTGEAPPQGGWRNFQGARALTCSATWKVF